MNWLLTGLAVVGALFLAFVVFVLVTGAYAYFSGRGL